MSEITLPTPVKAQRFEDIDEVQSQPGGFEYFRSGDRYPAGMLYNCPCGCKKTVAIDFRPHPSPSWEWDGNVDSPTLTPSLHDVGHWHGWLKNGFFTN